MDGQTSLDEDSSADFLPTRHSPSETGRRPKTRNVLIIEDNPIDVRVVAHYLENAKNVDFARTLAGDLATGLHRLADGQFDIVLLDLVLSDCEGLESFRRVHSRAPLVPIIVLSGLDDESVALQAVREGAQDYLVKGQFDANLLVRSIRYSMARQRAKSQLARALDRVQASERDLHDVISSNVDGMVVVDKKGTIRFLNPAAETLFGRSASELLNSSFGFPIEACELTEIEIGCNDGRRVPVEMRTVEILWEDETVHLAVLRDLSFQKRAEAERAQLEGIARSTEDAILSTDLDGIITSWNVGGEKTFGYSTEQAVGQSISILAPPDECENVAAMLDRVRRGEAVSQVGVMRVATDDTPIDVSISMFPIRNKQDVVVGIGGIIRDITDREQARRAVRESEARYRSLFEDSPVPLREEDLSDVKVYVDQLRDSGIKDVKSHFENHPEAVSACATMVRATDANTATLKLYGAKSKEEFRERFAVSFDNPSRDRFRNELIAIAEGETKFECQTSARTFAGEDRDVALRWTVAPGHEETLSRVWVSTVDVTDIKRTQEELRRHEVRLMAAQAIQEELLPRKAPNLEGFDIAGALSPAQFAAGDYFDYVTMADGAMGFVVGDVSGHGFGSSLLMAATSGHLRSLVRAHDDIQEVLGLLNRALAARTNAENFVTMFLGRLDQQSRSFTYASAGHPSGYVLGRSGQVRTELPSTGLPLAIDADAEFSAGPTVTLQPGDTVLLLTDGFLEAKSPAGEYFQWDHVLGVVNTSIDKPAADIIDRLYQAVREFAQRETSDDDLTAVVIKVES